ncbi:hypothetical protein RBSWK_01483 [Rhodopirellula baltica SWK14]|uniref:Uncharacterized protein n=1 Tax=Rhodopirellula baltica SWK14 TaxID=993516 RepID=L7CJZ7_RHOBT|nr:hypothetical protein RBSWK_01483 [Rhodopirellula baltica SWK14]
MPLLLSDSYFSLVAKQVGRSLSALKLFWETPLYPTHNPTYKLG